MPSHPLPGDHLLIRASAQIQEFRLIRYFGNGPYCYANASSMLITSVGENIPPSLVEPVTGVGLGAFYLPQENLLFFSNLSNPPDRGISTGLRVLGFDFDERSSDKPGQPPYEDLRQTLANSPAVLGPLDMGFLNHNPNHNHQKGADHFVLARKIEGDEIHFHDPEGFQTSGFPSVKWSLLGGQKRFPIDADTTATGQT